MKRIYIIAAIASAIISASANADTIGHYAGIAKSIPEAALKADPKSQAWAHSARTILQVAEESIAESLASAQRAANKLNKPLFCLPKNQSINTALIHEILKQNVDQLTPENESNNLSDVVVASLSEKFPCQATSQVQSAQEALFAPKEYKMVHVEHSPQ